MLIIIAFNMVGLNNVYEIAETEQHKTIHSYLLAVLEIIWVGNLYFMHTYPYDFLY